MSWFSTVRYVGCQKYGRAVGRACRSSRQASGSAVNSIADCGSSGLTVAAGSDFMKESRSLNSGAAAAVFCGSGFGLSWAPETITVTVAASTGAAYEKNRRRHSSSPSPSPCPRACSVGFSRTRSARVLVRLKADATSEPGRIIQMGPSCEQERRYPTLTTIIVASSKGSRVPRYCLRTPSTRASRSSVPVADTSSSSSCSEPNMSPASFSASTQPSV